jgi:nitrogen fixation NifU-like protein
MLRNRLPITLPSLQRPLHRLYSRGFGHSRRILALVKDPAHAGRLGFQDPDTGTGLVCAPAPTCDDIMRLQIRVQDATIIETKFQTFGSRSAVATSEYVAGLLEGRNLTEAYKITTDEIIDAVGLSYDRRYCSNLATDAIRSAIRDYKTKHPLE